MNEIATTKICFLDPHMKFKIIEIKKRIELKYEGSTFLHEITTIEMLFNKKY